MGAIASQITNLRIVFSNVYSDADQRKHQSSASQAFVRGIHRWPVNSPHKWPVTQKMFPFDDIKMGLSFVRVWGENYLYHNCTTLTVLWFCTTTMSLNGDIHHGLWLWNDFFRTAFIMINVAAIICLCQTNIVTWLFHVRTMYFGYEYVQKVAESAHTHIQLNGTFIHDTL